MKALKVILARILAIGVLMFFIPLVAFTWQPGAVGKMAAFHAMLTSLTGVVIVIFAFLFRSNIRRQEQMEEKRVSNNAKFLDRLLGKDQPLKPQMRIT